MACITRVRPEPEQFVGRDPLERHAEITTIEADVIITGTGLNLLPPASRRS
jgi:hypothetical protein